MGLVVFCHKMQDYLQSHPWIKFTFDFTDAPPKLWLLLGEAASKCDHIAGVPLRPAEAQKLHSLYLAKGVHATTAIEGNTLSEEQVLLHLEGNLEVPDSQEYLIQEIDNILSACNQIATEVQNSDGKLTSELYQADLTDKCLKTCRCLPRSFQVNFERTRLQLAGIEVHPLKIAACSLSQKLCDWLESPTFAARKGLETIYAIIKAVVAHLYLAWIHPFGDRYG